MDWIVTPCGIGALAKKTLMNKSQFTTSGFTITNGWQNPEQSDTDYMKEHLT